MAIKVGINGYGRIGRMVFRARRQRTSPTSRSSGINDLLEPDYLAYMLKYDSVHGKFKGDIAVEGDTHRRQRPQDPPDRGQGPGRS